MTAPDPLRAVIRPALDGGPAQAGRALRGLRLASAAAVLALLAACASHSSHLSAPQQAAQYKNNASGDYNPPGPPDDPWGPYIADASRRFDVPESWIRHVMHTESGGQLYVNGQLVTSPVGAMGLMQVMPETYQELQAEYGLGNDPYNPHDNIMAGAAYLREMYDLFGSPGFLAAYNAGPQRLNEYLTDGRPLPQETTHYVAMIEPYIQGDMPTGRSPADQFAMNSLNAPSGRPYGSGGGGASLAETGGGPVSNGTVSGSTGALVAMNEPPASNPVESSTDALNAQQMELHSAELVTSGGGAVPADLMVAANQPRPGTAQQAQQELAAAGSVTPMQAVGYQPAVVEQTPIAPPVAAPLPAARPVFQVAPSYQPAYARAAPVPAGTHLAENMRPAPVREAASSQYREAQVQQPYKPEIIGPGGMQNLAMEVNAPPTSYRPRAQTGLHLISPAEADTMPFYGTGRAGAWGIQVGAYNTAGDARAAVEAARRHERVELAAARSIVMPVHVAQRLLYRARLSGLSENTAVNACQGIRGRTPCMVLSPDALSD